MNQTKQQLLAICHKIKQLLDARSKLGNFAVKAFAQRMRLIKQDKDIAHAASQQSFIPSLCEQMLSSFVDSEKGDEFRKVVINSLPQQSQTSFQLADILETPEYAQAPPTLTTAPQATPPPPPDQFDIDSGGDDDNHWQDDCEIPRMCPMFDDGLVIPEEVETPCLKPNRRGQPTSNPSPPRGLI